MIDPNMEQIGDLPKYVNVPLNEEHIGYSSSANFCIVPVQISEKCVYSYYIEFLSAMILDYSFLQRVDY